MSEAEIIRMAMASLEKQMDALREELKRHSTLIEQMRRDNPITRVECEKYRSICPANDEFKKVWKEIAKCKGVPPWVTILMVITSSLIVFIVTYFSK